MVTILLPTMAILERDVRTMFSLLEGKLKHTGHGIGLEIMGVSSHFQNEDGSANYEGLGKIKKNLISVAKGAMFTIHGFSGMDIYENGRGDMSQDKGRILLETYLHLAKEIEGAYVHIHSGAGYLGCATQSYRTNKFKLIRNNLLRAYKNSEFSGSLGIENLPYPCGGDDKNNPSSKDVQRDCVENLDDLSSIIQGTPIKLTFDTCHYACNARKIDLVKAVKKWGGNIGEFHVSDSEGFWIPGKSHWTEGIIPGNGRIGESSFKELFAYIRDSKPDARICIEVNNKDFGNPAESEESLQRIINWLR